MNLVLVPMCGGVLAAISIPNFVKFQCRSKQSEAKANLKSLYVAQEMFRGENNSYASDLTQLQFKPQGQTIRYDYVLVEGSATGFRAEARGKADMAGDLWSISNANDLQNVESKCGGAERP
ncbi:MAG: hypothetical protein IT383_04040 [Deltaproteobacteria bacterium]|nr:hypothetical protein [Deltaproteobacteria bacterium]